MSVTGNSTCKGPEVERNLTCFSNREKFNAVGKSSVKLSGNEKWKSRKKLNHLQPSKSLKRI